MTDEPTDGLEQRLRADLAEIADTVPVAERPAPTTNVVPITAVGRERRSRLVAGGVVAAAAALVVGVLIWRSDDTTSDDVRIQDPISESVTPPPAPSDAAVSVWLSETRVPASGAEVVMILRGGPDGTKFRGPAAIERWSGSAWRRVDSINLCLEWSTCDLEVLAEGSSGGGIYLGTQFSGTSGPVVVGLADLDPGSYRLRIEPDEVGEPALGQFEVVDDEVRLPDLTDVFWQGMGVGPPMIGTDGGRVDLYPRLETGESWADQEAHFGIEVQLRRWTDGEWTDVVTLPVAPFRESRDGGWASVELPALEPGSYQLVRSRDDGEPAVAPIWVGEDRGAGAAGDPMPTVPPVPAGCPSLPDLVDAAVNGETLLRPIRPWGAPDAFGAVEGGAESFVVSETFQVAAAMPVRPVIDFVGERTAVEGPVRLWWAGDDRVEAWVSADGCDTVGLSATGGSRDQNASAAYELAGRVADDAGLDLAEPPATECPAPVTTPADPPTLYFYCPFDDVDQIPRPPEKFVDLTSPEGALRVLFGNDPPLGWGTGIPLVMRGARVDVAVDDGLAQVAVDYDFDAAPINGFSTSFMSIAYLNQIQATLFQFPEIQAIDLDTLCCGEWGGQVTRADWEAWLAEATER